MVTKRAHVLTFAFVGLILAKIHMVTKHHTRNKFVFFSLILAKIHMVTKRCNVGLEKMIRLILAKIHMVTKLYWWFGYIGLESYSSKNPYGNKTEIIP